MYPIRQLGWIMDWLAHWMNSRPVVFEAPTCDRIYLLTRSPMEDETGRSLTAPPWQIIITIWMPIYYCHVSSSMPRIRSERGRSPFVPMSGIGQIWPIPLIDDVMLCVLCVWLTPVSPRSQHSLLVTTTCTSHPSRLLLSEAYWHVSRRTVLIGICGQLTKCFETHLPISSSHPKRHTPKWGSRNIWSPVHKSRSKTVLRGTCPYALTLKCDECVCCTTLVPGYLLPVSRFLCGSQHIKVVARATMRLRLRLGLATMDIPAGMRIWVSAPEEAGWMWSTSSCDQQRMLRPGWDGC